MAAMPSWEGSPLIITAILEAIRGMYVWWRRNEYEPELLKLTPDIAVITSMDADHLDIYGTAAEVQQAFIEFSAS